MSDAFLHRYLDKTLAPLGAQLAQRVSANTLTVAAALAGAVALPEIGYRKYFFGLGFLVLRGVLDIADGAVARSRGTTAFGGYLDRLLDLVITAAVPFAFALAEPDRALAAMFLLLGLVARAAASTAVSGDNTPLLVGKSELFVAFAAACVFPQWFSIIAYVTGILCFVAAGVRAAQAMTSLRA
ncbi:MAG: CDP-alcohol phosphatidyltransferase family protein [Alphaproteobacteria bacterium]|nr:CDP-alcohol phosphatidyltransferase family protein [Alphaproteobacteria bacterium]